MSPWNSAYGMGAFGGIGIPLFVAILLWGLFWKGLGLWHSARRADTWWFLAILLINLFGILEIIYLFVVLKLAAKDLFSADAGTKKPTE